MHSCWPSVSVKLSHNDQVVAEISDLCCQLSGHWLFRSSTTLGQHRIVSTTVVFQDCPHYVMPNRAEVTPCMGSNNMGDPPTWFNLFRHSIPPCLFHYPSSFLSSKNACSILVKSETKRARAGFVFYFEQVTKDQSLFLWWHLSITLKHKASSRWMTC